uniref:DUF6598 domain-containing protein n=1 Tax=Oryza glumipatula TaxID=40148 RepID=A0A0E0BUD8_9ORYZ
MKVDGGGDETAAAAMADPGRGKKRPPSPSTPPTPSDDGEDSDDSCAVSDEEEEEDEDEGEEDQEENNVLSDLHIGLLFFLLVLDDKPQRFWLKGCTALTVDDFPRLSSDHSAQTEARYRFPDLRLQGPLPLILFRAFNDPLTDKRRHWFGSDYRLDDESEINVNSARTVDCLNGCRCHSMNLLQLIDLKISGYRHTQPGRAKIFGFFAVRDDLEPLRNYVFRHAIDNYEAVSVKPKTGMACLPLTSPARGICITSRALFEFQLCIRTEDSPEAEDEPKGGTLIEGCTEFTNILRSTSFTETVRLYGEKCGLDVKFLLLVNAVQATVDVGIIHSPACGLNLKLYAKTSGFSDVLRLFRGVAQSSRKISSVVAVVRRSHLDLCIEGSPADIDLGEKLPCTRWEHRFGAGFHGTVEEVVKLGDFTTISVKVTWKAVSKLPP